MQITAELLDIAAGSRQRPVRGSGVFVGGHGDWNGASDGGRLSVSTMRTGEIHTDGGIAPGTPDLISGGVFVISGAVVDRVLTAGPTTTYGQNDMVLDNWGEVTTWAATAPAASHGPSGIGFVNFGTIDRLEVSGPITTTGTGARGFNLYDGSIRHASFADIVTTGDGSVGGAIDTFTSTGRIATRGDDVVTVDIGGTIGRFAAAGGIAAEGAGSDAVHLRGDVPGLTDNEISAADGERLVRLPA